MKAKFEKIIIELLWSLSSFVKWFDKVFTIKASVKKVTGDDYYKYRDLINKGMVFVTSTGGQGSNLINPSKDKHGAIYFGRGLKTYIEEVIFQLERDLSDSVMYVDSKTFEINIKKQDLIKRLSESLVKYGITDDICYVIESVGEGVKPTNLVKFMTTKDLFVGFNPIFVDEYKRKEIMNKAANIAVLDLGLPYDYGFSDGEDAKYCFEVPADAYKLAYPGLELKKEKLLGHQFFLASAFRDKKNWKEEISLPLAK